LANLGVQAMFDPTPELSNDTLTIMVRFPTRVRSALEYAGLKTIGEVRQTPDADLLSIPDLGNESVRYLRRVIGNRPAGAGTD
jgi:DNA-directed RNA polymerase alpha subunit